MADPLGDTAGNFARAAPLTFGLGLLMVPDSRVSAEGVFLAVVSGAVTSAVGYVVWYAALRGGGRTHHGEQSSDRAFVRSRLVAGGDVPRD